MIEHIKNLLNNVEQIYNINQNIKLNIRDINNIVEKKYSTINKYYDYDDSIRKKLNNINLMPLSLRDSKEIILRNDNWRISFKPPYRNIAWKENNTKRHFNDIRNVSIYASKKYLYAYAFDSKPIKVCSLKSLLENKSLDSNLLNSLIKIWQLNFKRYNLINNILCINVNKKIIGGEKIYGFNINSYNYNRDYIKDTFLIIHNGSLELLPNKNIYRRIDFIKAIESIDHYFNLNEFDTIKTIVSDDFLNTILHIITSRNKRLQQLDQQINIMIDDVVNRINIINKLKY